METKTKRSLIIWSIVVLVVLNLSSLATIWYHRYQFKKVRKTEFQERRREGRRPAENAMRRRMPPYMIRDLDLSPGQEASLDSIWQHYNDKRQILEDSMDQNRVIMFSVMMEENLDTIRYEELSDKQTRIMRQLNNTMLDMNRAIRSNLTVEQQQALTKRMQEIRTRMPKERRHRMRK